jgi:hypothetical protein
MARTEAERRARARRTRRIEAAALGLLAALPLVPYLTFLLGTGVQRFRLLGDLALIEQATRHVGRGEALLGPYASSGFHHPGPLFFYLAAPMTVLFGTASTGLFVATCILNGAAAVTLVTTTRLFAKRAHAVAALLGVLAWFAAFGSVATNPEGSLVVALPLLAFLVLSALVARGRSSAACPAAFFGVLAAQTHIAVLSTVVTCGAISTIAFVVRGRYRRQLERLDGFRFGVAAFMVVLLFLPPLAEQLLSKSGNLGRLWSYVVQGNEPLKPLAVATQHWTSMNSWLVDRVAHRALLREDAIPFALTPVPLTSKVTEAARMIAIAQVALMTLAGLLAASRRDTTSLSLLAFGLIGSLIAVLTPSPLSANMPSDMFWMTAPTCAGFIGVLAAVSAALAARAREMPRLSEVVVPLLIVIGLTAAVTATSFQRFWLVKNPSAFGSQPDPSADLRQVLTALDERATKEVATVVIHRAGAASIADALVLELEKDGFDVRATGPDRDVYAGIRGDKDAQRPLHVYAATKTAPLPSSHCLESIAKSGDITLFGGSAPATCP